MSIDQTTLANRLRQAREEIGITQENAAESLGLARTALVQIENANRAVSSLELARFAKLYRRDMGDFFEERMPEPARGPRLAIFRLNDELSKDPQLKRELERCIDICTVGAELKEMLSFPTLSGPPLYQHPVPSSVTEAVQQGQKTAQSERQRLGLDDSPIPDMSDLLNNECGLWACGAHLPDSMSGLFMADPRFGLVILVNFSHPRGRKRFSYAHEYAHTLFDRELEGAVTDRTQPKNLRETRANAFAAAFLMPESGVLSFVRALNKGKPSRQETPVFDVAVGDWSEASIRPTPGSQTLGYQDVALVADHFRVSYEAAVYRLRSVNIIGSPERDSLLKQEEQAYEYMCFLKLYDYRRTSTDEAKDREIVAQVAHLAIEAYRQEVISGGRVREIGAAIKGDGRELLRFAQASRTE